jgi:hypothetical protein
VIGAYLRDATAQTGVTGSGAISVSGAQLLDEAGRPVSTARPGAALTLRVDYDLKQAAGGLTLGLILYRSTDHLIVYEGNVVASEIGFDADSAGPRSVDFRLQANLIRGQYHIESYVLHTATHEYLSRLSPAAMFAIEDANTCRGVADIALHAHVRQPAAG